MFTGIVEDLGMVRYLGPATGRDGIDLGIRSPFVGTDSRIGDSVAVNGVCLTVTRRDEGGITVGLSPETMRRTALHDLRAGDRVNLERSLPVNGRYGGHVVQGHVDGVATIAAMHEE